MVSAKWFVLWSSWRLRAKQNEAAEMPLKQSAKVKGKCHETW
ncbi:MAG: hypothetical protein OEY94_08105 [Alphaproteobacteria bacterium]|nr:hypothetical protein [Alphaproteobacteria bacterium]